MSHDLEAPEVDSSTVEDLAVMQVCVSGRQRLQHCGSILLCLYQNTPINMDTAMMTDNDKSTVMTTSDLSIIEMGSAAQQHRALLAHACLDDFG